MNQWRPASAAMAAVVIGDPLPEQVLAAQASAIPGARPRHREFRAEPAQVVLARQFVRRSLAGCATADDAALLTSELFTNALMHSRSGRPDEHSRSGVPDMHSWSRRPGRPYGPGQPDSVHVVVCHRCPGTARVTVLDGGSASEPTVLNPGWLRTTGRGLMLVQEVASSWGHDGGEYGRAVWFELTCPEAERPTLRAVPS